MSPRSNRYTLSEDEWTWIGLGCNLISAEQAWSRCKIRCKHSRKNPMPRCSVPTPLYIDISTAECITMTRPSNSKKYLITVLGSIVSIIHDKISNYKQHIGTRLTIYIDYTHHTIDWKFGLLSNLAIFLRKCGYSIHEVNVKSKDIVTTGSCMGRYTGKLTMDWYLST